MNYLSVKKIRALDRKATEKYGIPSLVLMENAGRAVAEVTLKLLNRLPVHPLIAIFCGGGNNGGDGFVTARYLLNKGCRIRVYLLKNPTEISGDALTNLKILQNLQVKIKILTSNLLKKLSQELQLVNIVIDAILGTGIKGNISDTYSKVIRIINQSNKPVIAVDIPSGLDGDTGLFLGDCIQAKITVTMGYPKKGFLNPEAKKFLGKVVVADIGYPFKGRN